MRRTRRLRLAAVALANLRRFARIGGRTILLTTIACVLSLIVVQFIGIVAKNLAVARELAATRASIAALQIRARDQRRTIVRLSDPRGAIPEIHDRLHVVTGREELIYVRGQGARAAEPGDWRPQP